MHPLACFEHAHECGELPVVHLEIAIAHVLRKPLTPPTIVLETRVLGARAMRTVFDTGPLNIGSDEIGPAPGEAPQDLLTTTIETRYHFGFDIHQKSLGSPGQFLALHNTRPLRPSGLFSDLGLGIGFRLGFRLGFRPLNLGILRRRSVDRRLLDRRRSLLLSAVGRRIVLRTLHKQEQ